MATMEVKFTPEDLKAAQSAERIPEPTAVVIFGASGDLTKRKLLPALFHLEQAGLLPKEFAIVGVARRALGDEFTKDMRAEIIDNRGAKGMAKPSQGSVRAVIKKPFGHDLESAKELNRQVNSVFAER